MSNFVRNFTRKGILFVVSAPSGTGKSTLCNGLKQTPDFVQVVTCTTRPPRASEQEGVDYYFLTKKEFKKRIEKNDFLEYVRQYDHYYGTLAKPVLDLIDQGKDILLNVEVNGANCIRNHLDPKIREALVDVFIMPPTHEELESRLRKRGTESEKEILRRLNVSLEEVKRWKDFKYTILSTSMEEDLIKFRAIMKAERYLSRRLELNHV